MNLKVHDTKTKFELKELLVVSATNSGCLFHICGLHCFIQITAQPSSLILENLPQPQVFQLQCAGYQLTQTEHC